MPGSFRVAHREGNPQPPVLSAARTHAEMNQVVPVERRQQERRGHAGVDEPLIRLALAVEMRNLVLPHDRRHAIVVESHPAPRVFERRPDDVLHAGMLGRGGHRSGLSHLPFRRKMLPVVGDAKRRHAPRKKPVARWPHRRGPRRPRQLRIPPTARPSARAGPWSTPAERSRRPDRGVSRGPDRPPALRWRQRPQSLFDRPSCVA